MQASPTQDSRCRVGQLDEQNPERRPERHADQRAPQHLEQTQRAQQWAPDAKRFRRGGQPAFCSRWLAAQLARQLWQRQAQPDRRSQPQRQPEEQARVGQPVPEAVDTPQQAARHCGFGRELRGRKKFVHGGD